MANIAIIARTSGEGPVFEFTTGEGLSPRVRHVAVFDWERRLTRWSISAGIYGGVNPRGELEQRLRDAGLSIPPDLDPLEDLSPTDPRYRIAEHHLLDVVEASNPELGRLVYGVVPPGFRQLAPEEGPAAPLEVGRTYELTLSGPSIKGGASLEFEAV